MLRGDFHHHINTDLVDGKFVYHSAGELVDRAVASGLNVLAITCHESVPYDGDVVRYAADRGMLLLRGMEATVDGQHVLLLNFPEFPPGVCTMADVAAAKTGDSLVVAPHPFYPTGVAAGETLTAHPGLFDAVEFSGLYTALTKWFNRRAADYAHRAGLPVIGNSDTHFLWQVGRTFTLIDARPESAAVLEAVRRGRVQLVTQPLSWVNLVRFVVESRSFDLFGDSLQYMVRVLRRTRRRQVQSHPLIAEPAPEAVRQSTLRPDERRENHWGGRSRR
ncbi:MAG: PHP domain-containing protein [Candidatus Binatia bacterium]